MSTMDTYRLIRAIRHQDVDSVAEILKEPKIDVNAEIEVEGYSMLPQETPLYATTALLEACRTRDTEIIKMVLDVPSIDVNKKTTALGTTVFADACFRGDVPTAEYLLRNAKIDASLCDNIVPHPAVYAIINGNLQLLEIFAKFGLLEDSLEDILLATAIGNHQEAAVNFINNHYIDARPLSAIPMDKKPEKIRRVCMKYSLGSSSQLPTSALSLVCEELGVPLKQAELSEIQRILAMTATLARDGRQMVNIEELVAFWLSAD